MANLSNINKKIMKDVYLDMYKRMVAYTKKYKKEPRIIYLKPGGTGDYVSRERFRDMQLRFDGYWKRYGRQPNYVCVVKFPCDTSIKTGYVQSFEKAVNKTVNTYTEGYNAIKNRIYKYYFNDIYKQSTALERLKNRSGLNCADVVQLMYQLAIDLGYQARIVHVVCKSGTGHLQLDVKGREFGSSWKRNDPAAALKSGYNLGSLWCSDGQVIAYNPVWMLSDDGRT